MTVTDYADWNTPQAHADDISNTGVPLLSRPDNLINLSGTVASNSTTVVASNVHVSKPGYEISVTVFAPATNQSILSALVTWSDSVSGVIVGTQEWDFYAGSGPVGNAHVIRGTGPTEGDTLSLSLVQNVSTVTASFTVVMAQNSRVYARHDWRTQKSGPVTGIGSSAQFLMQGNVLAQMQSLAVASGASVTALLPLYAGKATITSVTTSAAADMQTLIKDDSLLTGSFSNDQVVTGKTDATGIMVIQTATFPRSQCQVQQINNNAAAKNLLTYIVASEY